MDLAVSPLNMYCKTKNPSNKAIHNHMILNRGGLGVIFLPGIFFLPLICFENFSFILKVKLSQLTVALYFYLFILIDGIKRFYSSLVRHLPTSLQYHSVDVFRF